MTALLTQHRSFRSAIEVRLKRVRLELGLTQLAAPVMNGLVLRFEADAAVAAGSDDLVCSWFNLASGVAQPGFQVSVEGRIYGGFTCAGVAGAE